MVMKLLFLVIQGPFYEIQGVPKELKTKSKPLSMKLE